LKPGDIAGLALLDFPYAWIGVSCQTNGLVLEQFTQLTGETDSVPLPGRRIWLRAHCDYLTEKAQFSYSADGKKFLPLGKDLTMLFQCRTFQGVRYSLFNFNRTGTNGGSADFNSFSVAEPHPHGLMRPIPFGKMIVFTNRADGSLLAVANETRFKVVDLQLGRVALKTPRGCVSVNPANGEISLKKGKPGKAETFQWMETLYGDTILMSLATDRYLQAGDGTVTANWPGPKPDRKDGSCFVWQAQ
jgi:xylan 1,4-beta-xylosidase